MRFERIMINVSVLLGARALIDGFLGAGLNRRAAHKWYILKRLNKVRTNEIARLRLRVLINLVTRSLTKSSYD
jgi:hypothetical protein